jgi:hypothetical protein
MTASRKVTLVGQIFVNIVTRLLDALGLGRGFQSEESSVMHRAICIVASLLILTSQAQARHFHHTSHHHLTYRSAHGLQNFRQAWAMASPAGQERVVGSRPYGCPNRFCGCEASLYKFGRIIPELNLASNWRRFPRTAPASGMAAVRSGHVMILESQVSGNIWNVHDGNSGGHVTREHARSIAGYTVVDPSAGSTRFAASTRFM